MIPRVDQSTTTMFDAFDDGNVPYSAQPSRIGPGWRLIATSRKNRPSQCEALHWKASRTPTASVKVAKGFPGTSCAIGCNAKSKHADIVPCRFVFELGRRDRVALDLVIVPDGACHIFVWLNHRFDESIEGYW
jgi:hypothetical protein